MAATSAKLIQSVHSVMMVLSLLPPPLTPPSASLAMSRIALAVTPTTLALRVPITTF